MKKVLTMVLAVLLIMGAFAATALAADWTEHGLDASNNSVMDAQTPQDADDAELIFKTRVRAEGSWDGMSNIITVGDYVYIGVGSDLIKLDKAGVEVGRATMTGALSWSPSIAYDNGTLFAYVNDFTSGYIEAVDAATMQRVWKSEPMPGMNGFSPITIDNGMLYTAVSGYDWGTYSTLPGFVIGMTTSDDDTGSQDEVKLNSFAYDRGQRYNWNGVAVSGNIAIVGSEDGNLDIIDAATGAGVAWMNIGSAIKSSVTYVGGQVYFGTATGVARLDVDGDGTIAPASLVIVPLGAQVSTTPVITGGRLYVGSGSFFGGMGLHVFDAATMTEVYRAEIAGEDAGGTPIPIAGIQGTPLVSTAYDDTYVYFAANAYPGAMTVLHDSAGQLTADTATLYMPEAGEMNYASTPVIADANGTIYYTNDSGYLFAVGKKIVPVPDQKVTVGGTLTDGSSPLTGYTFELHSTPQKSVTGTDGEFSFSDVTLEDHTLTLKDPSSATLETYNLAFAQGDSFAANMAGNDISITVASSTSAVSFDIEHDGETVTIAAIRGIENPQTGDSMMVYYLIAAAVLLGFAGILFARKAAAMK